MLLNGNSLFEPITLTPEQYNTYWSSIDNVYTGNQTRNNKNGSEPNYFVYRKGKKNQRSQRSGETLTVERRKTTQKIGQQCNVIITISHIPATDSSPSKVIIQRTPNRGTHTHTSDESEMMKN
jgi:hypothetical protein